MDCLTVVDSFKRLAECMILKVNFSNCEFGDMALRFMLSHLIGYKNLKCLEIVAKE